MALVKHKVLANTAFLFLNTGTDVAPVWVSIVCQTNLQFNRTRQEIDARTKCGADYQGGTLDFQITCDGQLIINPDTPAVSIKYLHDAIVNNTKLSLQIAVADPQPGDITYTFKGILTALNDAYQIDTASTFSATIRVDASTLVTTTEPDA